MGILKTGIVKADISTAHYLVNNFTESGTTTGWSLSGWTLSDGVLVGTNTTSTYGPGFNTTTFSIGTDDVICVEFTVSLPTPSTTTGGPGIYIGTQYGQAVYLNGYNFSTKKWSISTSTVTNPYFLHSYNSSDINAIRTYIFGSNVSTDVMNLYAASRTNSSYSVYSVKLSDGLTSTYLRSGYNTNSTMVINLSNVRVYNVLNCGMTENDGSLAKIGKGYCLANGLIED